MEFIEEALLFVDNVKDLYFCKRDMEGIQACLSEDITWLGTGEEEVCSNFEEACIALQNEFCEYEGSFTIVHEDFHAQKLSETECLVYGLLRATPYSSALCDIALHISLIIKKTKEGLKLAHCNFSRPDEELEENHFYVNRATRYDATVLQKEISNQKQQLAILMSNIPGGVHQCENDEVLTLLGVSDGFLHMVGYSREEIQTEFHNEFVKMIYPEDRERVVQELFLQMNEHNTVELEYRVLCKNGDPIWILDKGKLYDDGRHKTFYCILIEISDRKKQQEELRLSLERHELIMAQTTDIIFEWDLKDDTLMFSNNWMKRFHYPPIHKNAKQFLIQSQHIHTEDKTTFYTIMKDVLDGKPFVELECRICDAHGKDIWCHIRATTQFDDYQRPVKAIGVIMDITEDKIEKEDLRNQAQRDPLTKLYNRSTLKLLTEQDMQQKEREGLQAIMIIDVDDFKQINDIFGHLSGDALLQEVANILETSFRVHDIVGRIGGDEFMVYVSTIKDEEVLKERAKTILDKFHAIELHNGIDHIGCSIGAIVFTSEESDYFSLYEKADQALYHQKNHGKDGISIYNESMSVNQYTQQSVTDFKEALAMNEISVIDEEIIQYIFRTLYTARDIKKAIMQMLEFVGKSYDVSRTYIFENSIDDKVCNNTFEWCAEGVPSEIKNLQNQKYADMANYLDNFNERGIFYCRDIHELCDEQYRTLAQQGIYSMLQSAIVDNGKIVGWVGFDDCRYNRYWTRVQVNTLLLIGNVISIFLRKERLEERIRDMNEKEVVL